jgi:hypothetical protein
MLSVWLQLHEGWENSRSSKCRVGADGKTDSYLQSIRRKEPWFSLRKIRNYLKV